MYYDSSKGVWYIYDADNEKYITHGGGSAENRVTTSQAIDGADQKQKVEEVSMNENGNQQDPQTSTDVVCEDAHVTKKTGTSLQRIPISQSGKIVGILYKGKHAPKPSR